MPDIGSFIVDPYMSVATFKAHPTYLGLSNLRSGDSILADQDDELFDILLEASDWASTTFCRKPLHAHLKTDYTRVTPDRYGRMFIYPTEPPIRQVLSIAYSNTPDGQGLVTVPNPSVTIEDGAQVIYAVGGSSFSWVGPLQFGGPIPGYELFVTMSYAAAWTATVLTAPIENGVSLLPVRDPTAIQPGDMLRIWDPGFDETVYVSPAWVPVNVYPAVPTSVPIVGVTAFDHLAETTVSGLPPSVHLAIAHKGIDLLQRPGNRNSRFPGATVRSQTKTDGETPGSDHEARAMRILTPFRDVR